MKAEIGKLQTKEEKEETYQDKHKSEVNGLEENYKLENYNEKEEANNSNIPSNTLPITLDTVAELKSNNENLVDSISSQLSHTPALLQTAGEAALCRIKGGEGANKNIKGKYRKKEDRRKRPETNHELLHIY